LTSSQNQIVKLVTTLSNENYIIKIPKDPILNFRESFAYNLLKDKLSMAKVICSNKKYIIEEYITGDNLNQINLPNKKVKEVYTQLGRYLKKK
jgi:RIO-like serine/threonine protein kinase